MAWQADTVQGVIFTVNPSGQLDAHQLWQIATDGAPLTAFHNHMEMPNAFSTAEGVFEGFYLHVVSQLGRIALTLGPGTPTGTSPVDQPFRIADPARASDNIRKILHKIWPNTGIVRASLVCDLSEIVQQPEDVTKKLKDYTGVWFPFPPLDSVYQFNVRRPYEGVPAQMNRISTWGAGFMQVVEQTMPFPNFNMLQPARVQSQIPIVSWKIDVNSATNVDLSRFADTLIDENHFEFEALLRLGASRLRPQT